MKKHNMNISEINEVIEELIELSGNKYTFIKVGKDTLNHDILFIERYTKLKELFNTETFDTIDLISFPRMKVLKNQIEQIAQFENNKIKRNVRMTQATNAYRKK